MWSVSDVSKEVLEFMPPFAYCDSASPPVFESGVVGVMTSLKHIDPGVVERVSFIFTLVSMFVSAAVMSARLGFLQAVETGDSFRTAVASIEPKLSSSLIFANELDRYSLFEPLTGDSGGWHDRS